MAIAPNISPARALLDILQADDGQAVPSDAQASKAMTDFIDHLIALETGYKRKSWSERHLVEQVFGRMRLLKNDVEKQIYCRCHFRAAIEQLPVLAREIRDPATGTFALAALMEWRDVLIDYIFDLGEIVPFLQRRVPGYVYLRGGKNPTVHSWEVYKLAKGLAYHSIRQGQDRALDHKTVQIAAIGVLRQALELRFDRLIAVYPTDAKGRSPKLRHGFHQDFVVANPRFFSAQGFSIAELKPMYDWCSEIVHQAYQPYAWQTGWALSLGGRLLGPRAPAGGAWSIANAVEILDIQDMQAAFEAHFLDTYEHGAWRMTRLRPEALVRDWKETMASASPDLRPVNRRHGVWKRIGARLNRWWRPRR